VVSWPFTEVEIDTSEWSLFGARRWSLLEGKLPLVMYRSHLGASRLSDVRRLPAFKRVRCKHQRSFYKAISTGRVLLQNYFEINLFGLGD
jgi:hypothetical protein